jgi:hypothetical protein
MRRILFFLLVVSSLLTLPAIAKRFTHGFRIAKMRLEFPHHPKWEIEPNAKVNEILKQPFHFLGKGAQCYVFESKDGHYVIKLFRYNQPYVAAKVIDLFNACKIAYDQLREETGLIYIHLNPTPMNLPILHCKDAIGRKYQFRLDETRFAVQKKAKSFRVALGEAKENPAEMQKRIDELVSLLQARTAKGVINTDRRLSRNFGYLDNRAIEFDFGNYRTSLDLDRKQEMTRYTNGLRGWLKRHAPEWVAYLDTQVEAL